MISTQVAVCFEAAKRLLKPWEQILEPPLSADYVAERIVLAPSPPEGYVARERGERRRMQGFVLICDFCTFSKSLRWTSTHPAALAGPVAVLPHARVALDYFTLYEIANWQGDARTARAARERARWHLERTAAPDDRRLEALHVAAAITSNQTADLAEGMIGFSVDDGGDWEAPPEDDDVWTPVERGPE